ncbi:hypothetical protein [Janibacter melonis]|uniref:hypothetical protein n=1 Tax=Janibacter melonis TaxID=262209 RepID=UPI0018DDBC92|nr:hypothetical protein [Janibacter melonis]
MEPAPVSYHRASSVRDAVALLGASARRPRSPAPVARPDDEVEAANPHASVHVVPQAGHMVFWDNAQGADQVLSEALDAVDGA